MTGSALTLDGGAVVRLGSGFILIAAGSALFSHAAERLTQRLFSNRQMGARLLGNLSLSLPEAVLPLFAFLTADHTPGPSYSMDIGVGAILGAPAFLLGVLWPLYLLSGRKIPLPSIRRNQLVREPPILAAGLIGALCLGYVQSAWVKTAGGVLLLALYAFLVARIEPHETDSAPENQPASPVDGLAFLAGTGLILYGPELFLSGLREISGTGPSSAPFLLSLALSPLATELPELLALIFFLRRGNRTMGFDIVWGSIGFQLTVSLSVGLFLSPWTLTTRHAVLGGILACVLVASAIFGRSVSRDA